jgi:acyl-CoA synthetase (NDP forming)
MDHPLDYIFRASSVAFVGASNNPFKWGYRVLLRAIEKGFRGALYPINPKGGKILGLRAYEDVMDLPETPDLAVITVPAQGVADVLGKCTRKGIRGGVVITAGFSEIGGQGRRLEEMAVAVARRHGMRLVGPNSMGIWSSAVNLNIALDPAPKSGRIAFISQSGTFGGNVAQIAFTKGYGLSKFISIGNQADLDAADYVEYLASDPDTKVIVLYMEGFKEGRRFFETARRVVVQKPILIYKAGRSPLAARATLSHTGSMAGNDEVISSMLRQAGIIRAAELERVFNMAEALISQPLPRGGRVGIIGTGGQGVMTVDCCASLGLEVPELDADAKKRLMKVLPPHAPLPNNPVDFAAGARTALDEASVAFMLAQLDYIDGIIMNVPVNFAHRSSSPASATKVAIEGAELLTRIPRELGKPVVTLKWRNRPEDIVIEILRSVGIPFYDTPEDAAAAMYALVQYAQIRGR